MQIHEALSEALKHHKVAARTIALTAGLSESQVSLFLNGNRGMVYKNLSEFIRALPQPVYQEFCRLMAGGVENVEVEDAIATLASSSLTEDQIATLLNVASQKLRNTQSSTRAQVQEQLPVSA